MSSLQKRQGGSPHSPGSGIEDRGGVLKTHKTPDEVIDNLPPGFFTRDYDPVEKQLLQVTTTTTILFYIILKYTVFYDALHSNVYTYCNELYLTVLII